MFLYKKKSCSHRNIHHEDIKTWEVYKTHKHQKQFRFMCIRQANNTNKSAYQFTFTHLEWLKSHNISQFRPKVKRLFKYCNV